MRAREAGDGMGAMSRYDARLSAIENALSPDHAPQILVVFGDDDESRAVAALRVARNWPDDNSHPVKVIRVRWGREEPRNFQGQAPVTT